MKQPVDILFPPVAPDAVPYWRLVLRGCSQLCFQTNELTGLFFLAAVAVHSPIAAAYFLLAGLSFAQARETISRGMGDIGENARRIRKIIGNLKHLGKQDGGHMDELADIGKILDAVVTLLDARIRQHTDALTLDLPAALPAVRGNVQQLEQVFINVLLNALQSAVSHSVIVPCSDSG